MKKINLILIFAFCFSIQTLTATNPITLESYEEIVKSSETEQGFFKNVKRWLKKAVNNVKMKNLALTGLVIGILSLSGWISILSTGGFYGILSVMAILAITACVLSLIVLLKTAKEKSENRMARRMAIWGMIAGLLTGLFPFIVILIAIIAVLLEA